MKDMLEIVGPLAFAEAWGDKETNGSRRLRQLVDDAGGVGGAYIKFPERDELPQGNIQVNWGPLKNGKFLRIEFWTAGYPRRELKVNVEEVDFDPNFCRYLEECTCEGYDAEEEDECPYCSNGSDFCQTHSVWH